MLEESSHITRFLKRHISTSTTMPDIICIQKTFLHDQMMITMENYNIGCIATLFRTGISYSVLNNPSNMEALIVRMKLSTGDLAVANVYHRPFDIITDDVISDYRKLFNAYNRSAIIWGFQCYSTVFGTYFTDYRGRLRSELIEENSLVVLNTGAR